MDPKEDSREPPVVFLHGIGLGLAPYTGFLQRVIAQHPNRTVIAVQYKHVSMRLTSRIPTVTDVADDVAAFLADRVSGYLSWLLMTRNASDHPLLLSCTA